MARFSRLETLNTMKDIGLIPVFYNPDIEAAKNIVKACAEGGAMCVEMTNRGDHAIEVFAQLEKYTKNSLPGVILGVGSVIEAPTDDKINAAVITRPVFNPQILADKRLDPT